MCNPIEARQGQVGRASRASVAPCKDVINFERKIIE
jgi:hypothetical protein